MKKTKRTTPAAPAQAEMAIEPRADELRLFPTDPFEIERVVDLLIAEAVDETESAPSQLLRSWLAAELRRDSAFDELPATYSDAAYFSPGHFRECAELFAWLGHLAQRNRTRWESDSERQRERTNLLAAVKSLALRIRQYVGDVPAEDAPALIERGRKAHSVLAGRQKAARDAGRIRGDELAARGEATRSAVIRTCERLLRERRLSAGALYERAASELRAEGIALKSGTVEKYWRQHLKPNRKRTHRR